MISADFLRDETNSNGTGPHASLAVAIASYGLLVGFRESECQL